MRGDSNGTLTFVSPVEEERLMMPRHCGSRSVRLSGDDSHPEHRSQSTNGKSLHPSIARLYADAGAIGVLDLSWYV